MLTIYYSGYWGLTLQMKIIKSALVALSNNKYNLYFRMDNGRAYYIEDLYDKLKQYLPKPEIDELFLDDITELNKRYSNEKFRSTK